MTHCGYSQSGLFCAAIVVVVKGSAASKVEESSIACFGTFVACSRIPTTRMGILDCLTFYN